MKKLIVALLVLALSQGALSQFETECVPFAKCVEACGRPYWDYSYYYPLGCDDPCGRFCDYYASDNSLSPAYVPNWGAFVACMNEEFSKYENTGDVYCWKLNESGDKCVNQEGAYPMNLELLQQQYGQDGVRRENDDFWDLNRGNEKWGALMNEYKDMYNKYGEKLAYPIWQVYQALHPRSEQGSEPREEWDLKKTVRYGPRTNAFLEQTDSISNDEVLDTIKEIYEMVADSVTYAPIRWADTEDTLETGKGSCGEHGVLLYEALMRHASDDLNFTLMHTTSHEDSLGHTWVRVHLGCIDFDLDTNNFESFYPLNPSYPKRDYMDPKAEPPPK